MNQQSWFAVATIIKNIIDKMPRFKQTCRRSYLLDYRPSGSEKLDFGHSESENDSSDKKESEEDENDENGDSQ